MCLKTLWERDRGEKKKKHESTYEKYRETING